MNDLMTYENKYCHYLTKLNISRNTVSWMFENVFILMATMVMNDLIELIENKYCHYLTKLNISRNTVSWMFENVFILMATMVMDDLMTLVN